MKLTTLTSLLSRYNPSRSTRSQNAGLLVVPRIAKSIKLKEVELFHIWKLNSGCFSVSVTGLRSRGTSFSLDPTLTKIWDDRTPEKRWCQPPRRPQMMRTLRQHRKLPNLARRWIAIYNHCMLFTVHFCHMDINLTYSHHWQATTK